MMNNKIYLKYIKYKTKYNKLKNLIGGDIIIDIVKKYFSDAEINYDNNIIKVLIKCNDYPSLKENVGEYIHFSIREDQIYLHLLRKCNSMSGGIILQKIKNLANDINLVKNNKIKKIVLSDVSIILLDECPDLEIKLSHLNILLEEISWYNKYDFKSKNFEREKIENSKTINLSFNCFLEKYLEKSMNNNFEKIISIFDEINYYFNSNLINIQSSRIMVKSVIQNRERLKKKIQDIFDYNEININVESQFKNFSMEKSKNIILCTLKKIKNKFIKNEMDKVRINIEIEINNTIELFNKIKNSNLYSLNTEMSIKDIITAIFNEKKRKLDCDSDETKFIIKIINLFDILIFYNSSLEYIL